MNILLIFDTEFDINKNKLLDFLKQKSKYLNFTVEEKDTKIKGKFISKPNSFEDILKLAQSNIELHTKKQSKNSFDNISKNIINKSEFNKVFVFTDKPYEDNYYFHTYNEVVICSFFAWDKLTSLDKTNGVLYFITDILALEIDPTGFRHKEVTGCIYDFLWDKRGIDDGMRQARICPNCLERLNTHLITDEQFLILEDLKVLMNALSNSSKWNKNILDFSQTEEPTSIIRKPKKEGEINIAIASPGDTMEERELLLNSLEINFRRNNHEAHCKHRLIVHGWEDLASQNGYAQDVINNKIIQEVDFVVSLFKHKLGTPTVDTETGIIRSESGTAEELLQTLDYSNENHPLGMTYFYSKAPTISLDTPNFETIKKEWDTLKKFKNTIKDKVIYKPFTNSKELMQIILKDLEKNIIDNFTN